ncbi:Six-hairpin glycosidase-like protein [Aspergillus pseudodeflectus]|uniref:Six-hairpin glycosidase-like protein n=1 Tax=Aspergillus pseudodeflectus TaxID=176178 RepID=A0ABR4LBP3_9EURO
MAPSTVLNGSSKPAWPNGHANGFSHAKKAEAGLKPVAAQTASGLGILSQLYCENITAKILRVAESCLENNDPPTFYPELVPQSGENKGQYSRRPMQFWTCGFFPGSIYLLLERATKYPETMRPRHSQLRIAQLRETLRAIGHKWSEPLHSTAYRTDTHDLGFMIMPHMRARWELLHDDAALSTICTAAASLYSRFNARVGAIRSWNHLTFQRNVDIRDAETNFLVIIDSLCNLELLFYAAAHAGYEYLATAAITHAKTLLKTHLRRETPLNLTSGIHGYNGPLYSNCHVVNFSPATGEVKEIRTAQGYAPESTWSRGQAWAILGYAQAYSWTKDETFLSAACGLAEYFIFRLETAPDCVDELAEPESNPDPDCKGSQTAPKRKGRYVPLWDFDAPIQDPQAPIRDVSAGLIAANGLLVLSQALTWRGRHAPARWYADSAIRIVGDTLALATAREQACLIPDPVGGVKGLAVCESGSGSEALADCKPFASILTSSTVSWNDQNINASANHGLVYADYYLLEFGNRLLGLGFRS